MTYELTEDINTGEYWCEKTAELSQKLFIPTRVPEAWSDYDNYARCAEFDNVKSDIKIKKVTAGSSLIKSIKHRIYPTKDQLKYFNLFFKGYAHCYNKTVKLLEQNYLPLYKIADDRYDEGLCNVCDKPHLSEKYMCEDHKYYKCRFDLKKEKQKAVKNFIVGTNKKLSEEDKWLEGVPNECRASACFAAVTAYNTAVKLHKKGKLEVFYLNLKDAKSNGIFKINHRTIKIVNDEVFIFTRTIKEPLKMTKRTKKYLPPSVNCESMVICKNNKYYFVSVNDYSKTGKANATEQPLNDDINEQNDDDDVSDEENDSVSVKSIKTPKAAINNEPLGLRRYFNEEQFNRDTIEIEELNIGINNSIDMLSKEIKHLELVKAKNLTLKRGHKERVKADEISTMEKDIKNHKKQLNEMKDKLPKAIKKIQHSYKILNQIKIIDLNAKRDNIIALDPGLNTFQTGYDPSGKTYKFGNKEDLHFIKTHHEKHDKLKYLMPLVTSKMRYRMKKRLLKINAKLTNRISDFHNKTAVFLATNYSNVIYPHLNVSQLKENCKASPTNRSYSALSHYKFKVKLERICAKYGSSLHQCKENYTTKTCGVCGTTTEVKGKQIYQCMNQDCDYVCDRDSHGARNILLRQLTYSK